MNEQELNKKLAEWAGFKYQVCSSVRRGYCWVDPQYGDHAETPPNFIQSLDACFRWIVPKAIDRIMAEHECSSDVAYAILFKKWLQELELIIPNAALSLCLAIEKLIDEVK